MSEQPFDNPYQPSGQAGQGYQPQASPFQQPQQQAQQTDQAYWQSSGQQGYANQGHYAQPAQTMQASYGQQVSNPGTTPLVLGIIAIVCATILWPTIIAPVVGIVLGAIAISRGNHVLRTFPDNGRARGGRACGIVGLVLSILGIIMGIVLAFGAMSVVANMDSSEMEMLQQELIEELESEGYNIPSDALSLG